MGLLFRLSEKQERKEAGSLHKRLEFQVLFA